MKDCKIYKVWQALGVLLLLLCSCRHEDSGRPVVAVSFESYKWIVERIVGDDYEVVALLPPGSDPEMFDPDMRTMKALERADLYLTTNSVGFETQVGERISSNYPSLKTIDLSEGIDLIMHTHGIANASEQSEHHDHTEADCHGHAESDAHQAGDPHLLSSWENAVVIAKNIGQAMAERAAESGDTEAAQRYLRNMSELQTDFAACYAETAGRLAAAGVRGKGVFVVMHPSLSYYARDYGLTQIPLEMDGKEASPCQLMERLELAADSNPIALFYEQGQSAARAEEIAESLGIKAYPVNMNGADFAEQIEGVTKNLIQ